MSKLMWGPISKTCPWPVPQFPEGLRQLQPSDVETLMVSSNLDVLTPPQHAALNVLPLLRRGHHVVLRNMSHLEFLDQQPVAFNRLVSSFLETGKADDSGFEVAAIDFKPRWKLTTLAKLGVLGVLCLPALLVLLIL